MTTATRIPAGIDAAALGELTKDGNGPRLLDVRTPGEFRTVHIPGAHNVPLDTLREHRAELLHHLDEDTVLICRSGARAARAEQALSDAGLPDLRVLEGGMVAWEAAEGPVTRGAARWELERQVRLIAGSIVLVSGLVALAVPGVGLAATAVGAGLTFAALTNTCAMGTVLARLPYNRGPRADIASVIAALRSRP
ncbi:rhodanese-like domain-containing protein [Kitasatospora sp. NPDC056138]|uniref:rhodanese-like domain-containing protein n=1 Tax=Kitasatospora sp. NPDC056138 TaxID=3345724 RepID=UPI0035E2EF0D